MANLSYREMFKNGAPYANRDDILIERIANAQLLKLDKD